MTVWPIATLPLEAEDDIVYSRQCARLVAQHLGFGGQDQTRIATALSEIARNAFGYAGGGKVEFLLDGALARQLVIRVSDRGGGIDDIERVLSGRYESATGMGLGIIGARRLMDSFDVVSTVSGTIVTMSKTAPVLMPLTAQIIPGIVDAVRALRSADRGAASRDEKRDLIESLASLAEREEEARRLNVELEETNRGVVALHAELERQAEELRGAGETLERQVAERTRELAEANEKLRAEAKAREQVEENLRQSQKMEAVGQLTGGIAHDFNNLLTGVVGALDLMLRRHQQGRYEKLEIYIEMALSSANRAAALTHRLLAFARRQPLDPKVIDVNGLILGMEDLLQRTVNEAIALRFSLDPGAWTAMCDPSQLENALLNLAINARDALPNGGHITVSTRNETITDSRPDLAPGDYVVARVADDGIGMPPEVSMRAFDPFFTTKPLGQGTGLGLSMIYGFARQSNGQAVITSAQGKGTAIDILLPRHDGAVCRTASAAFRVTTSGCGETILVVEDENSVRDLLFEALSEAGYAVIQARDGIEGLEVGRTAPRLDLLLTDIGLPGLNGRQLADALHEIRPSLKTLFITGYAESATSSSGFLGEGMAIITKPFVFDALVARVAEMLRGS